MVVVPSANKRPEDYRSEQHPEPSLQPPAISLEDCYLHFNTRPHITEPEDPPY